MAEERLQKILARAGIASRRKAEELISAGLVTINGKVATLGDKADLEVDAVKVEGRRVPPPVPQRYLVVNKPAGFVSTVADPEGRQTVLDLVPPALRKALVPVGRLDFQTEGLLLLTTDGEWAQRVAHPRYGCAKVYEAKVRAMPEDREIERLRRGMWIDGHRTLPAEVRLLRTTGRGRETGNTWWEVVLREGRSRQIREMFYRIGHGVLKLKRVAIGPLRDDELPLGAWRELTPDEVEQLRKAGKVSAKLQGRREEAEEPLAGGPGGRRRSPPPRRRGSGPRTAAAVKGAAAAGGAGGGRRGKATAQPGEAIPAARRQRRVEGESREAPRAPSRGGAEKAARPPSGGRTRAGQASRGAPGGRVEGGARGGRAAGAGRRRGESPAAEPEQPRRARRSSDRSAWPGGGGQPTAAPPAGAGRGGRAAGKPGGAPSRKAGGRGGAAGRAAPKGSGKGPAKGPGKGPSGTLSGPSRGPSRGPSKGPKVPRGGGRGTRGR